MLARLPRAHSLAIALAATAAATSPLAAQNGADAEVLSTPASAYASLRLGPGDAVRLFVEDEPGLVGEFPVLDDGNVMFPLIGLVPVAGSGFDEVVERVRRAYDAQLVSRDVVVQPLVRVRVLGEVRAPGLYLVDPSYDLRDVLARAGGMIPTASARNVLLVRAGHKQKVDMRDGGGWPGPLLSADEVVVQRRNWVSESLPLLIGAGTSVLAAAVTALLVR